MSFPPKKSKYGGVLVEDTTLPKSKYGGIAVGDEDVSVAEPTVEKKNPVGNDSSNGTSNTSPSAFTVKLSSDAVNDLGVALGSNQAPTAQQKAAAPKIAFRPKPLTQQELIEQRAKQAEAFKNRLPQAIIDYNTRFGTNLVADDILSDPEKSSAFLDDLKIGKAKDMASQYEAIKKQAESKAERPNANYDFGVEGVFDPNSFQNKSFQAIKDVQSHIVDATLDEATLKGLTPKQAVNSLFRRLDKKGWSEYVKNIEAKTEKPFAEGDDTNMWQGATDNVDLMLTTKAPYEMLLNSRKRERGNDMVAMGKLNNNEEMVKNGEDLLADVKSDTELLKDYPILQRANISDAITKELAGEAGQLKGTESETGFGLWDKLGIDKYLPFGKVSDQGKIASTKAFKDALANPATRDQALYILQHPDVLSDYSYAGSAAANFMKPAKDLFFSLEDIVGSRDRMDRHVEEVKTQLFPEETPDLKDYVHSVRNIVNTTALLGGYAALGAVGSEIASAAKLAPTSIAANTLNSGLSFGLGSFDANLKDADNFLDSDVSKAAYATIGAMVNTVGGELLHLPVLSKIPALQSPIMEMAGKISDGSITKEAMASLIAKAKDPYIDAVMKYGLNVTRNAAAMKYFTFANGVNKMAFGGSSLQDVVNETSADLFNTALGVSVMSLYGTKADIEKGIHGTAKSSLYKLATNADISKDVMAGLLKEGKLTEQEYNQKIQLINTAAKAKDILDAVQLDNNVMLDVPQRTAFVANMTAEGVLKKKLENPNLSKEEAAQFESQISNLQIQRDRILKGLKFDKNMTPLNELYDAESAFLKAREDFNNGVGSEEAIIEAKKKYVQLQNPTPPENILQLLTPIEKINSPVEDSKKQELLKEAKDMLDAGVVSGYHGETMKMMAENDMELFELSLREVAQQSQDPESVNEATRLYGKQFLEIANELYPIETNPYYNQKSNQNEGQKKGQKVLGTKSQNDNLSAAPAQGAAFVEPDVTVGEMIDKVGSYQGKQGRFYQDGQTVVFKVEGENKEYELGNIDEIKDTSIKSFGIGNEESVVSVGDNGNFIIRGKEYLNKYSDPMAAINRDAEGNVVSVNLDTPEGGKRTFRGNVAEDIAYQLTLKEITNDNAKLTEFEKFINSDQEARKEIESAAVPESSQAGTNAGDANVSREKLTAQRVEEPITDEQFNSFVDTGSVLEDILQTIADKVKNRQELSERETAIFSNKTGEINKLIANESTSSKTGEAVSTQAGETKGQENQGGVSAGTDAAGQGKPAATTAILDEIKSKNLTHVKNTGMGAKEADGIYISTESNNRYQREGQQAEKVTVDIQNPKVTDYVENAKLQQEKLLELLNTGQIDKADISPEYRSELEQSGKSVAEWYREKVGDRINEDYFEQSAREKAAKLITEQYKSEGYDSLYMPETPNQEGQLIVFDREKVNFGNEQRPVEKVKSKSEEPVIKGGRSVVTLSGLSEPERQSRIAQRKKETAFTPKEKSEQRMLEMIAKYNDLPNGRLGKLKPEGLQLLNDIRNAVSSFNKRYTAKYNFNDRAGKLFNSNGRQVNRSYLEVGDKVIDESGVVLRDRDRSTQEVFDLLNQYEVFPNAYRLDGKKMSAAELDATIQDIVDGIPSIRANNYLDSLEKQIEQDDFGIGNNVMMANKTQALTLNDLIGASSEQFGEPLTQDAIDKWLNNEADLTPEIEAILYDNIENLMQDYESENSNQENDQKSNPGTEGTTGGTGESNGGNQTAAVGEGEVGGITLAATEQARRDAKIADFYEKNAVPDAEIKAEAEKKMKDGYDMGSLIDKLKKGIAPDPVETVMLEAYLNELKTKVEENPSKQNQDALLDFVKATDAIGSIQGRSFRLRRGLKLDDESLAGYFTLERTINNDAPLTEDQTKTVIDEHKNITEAQQKYDQKIASLEAEAAKKDAEEKISKQARSTKKVAGQRDYKAERKALLDKLKQQVQDYKNSGNKLGIAADGGAESFVITAKMAKTISQIISNHVEELGAKLNEVVSAVMDEVKDIFPGITEKDIHDVIGGKYNEKKKTKNQLSADLLTLKQQVKYTEQLEKLEAGIEPKTEREKIKKNQKIEELKKKIKEHDLTQLAAYKARTRNEANKIEEQLKNGDFETEQVKKPVVLDKEARDLKDRLIKLKTERQVRIMKQRYENRDRFDKARDWVVDKINIPRTIMASLDFSAPLRQGIVAVSAHPILGAKAGVEMFKAAFSQKEFDRWIYEMRDSPRYEVMKEAGLSVTDPHNPFLAAKEEAFMNNTAEKIPYVGKLIKGSERAYVMFLNKMRVDVFNQFADKFEEQGKTIENSPELYKAMAKLVNSQTGRGNLGKLEEAAPVLNTVLFSPRLIASRVNLLTNWANPLWYKNTPKEIRVAYMKDMLSFIGLGLTILGMFKFAGGGDDDENSIQVETDPRSSDFGKIKKGDTRWDIWGGFQQYIRLVTQVALGEKKSSNTGEIQTLDTKGRFGEGRGDVLLRFARGKLAPVPSMVVDFFAKRTLMGDKVESRFDIPFYPKDNPKGNNLTLTDELASHLFPLIISDVYSAIKGNGLQSLITVGLPATFGVGVQTYSNDRPPVIPDKIMFKGVSVQLNEDQNKFFTGKAEAYIDETVSKLKTLPAYDKADKKTRKQMVDFATQEAIKKATKETSDKFKSQLDSLSIEKRNQQKEQIKMKKELKKQL